MMDSICLPFNALLVVAFPLFLLSSHLSLLSAKSDFSSCSAQQRQFCGNLNISYPFFNQSNWGCALEALRCRSSFTPGINSWVENEESTYEFQRIDYTNKTVLAHDRRFTRDSFLNDNDKCNALFNNFTMPPIFFSHLLAEVISPNLTLRVCKQRHQQEFNGSNDCKVEVLSDVADAPAPAPPSPLDSHGPPYDDCKLVYLPVDVPTNNSTIFHGRVDRVSQLFTAGFRLRWSLPKQCPQCDNGTVCLLKHHHQDNENFFCFDPEKGNKSHWLFIGIGIAAGILFPCLFFFVIYRYRTGHTHGVCIFSSNTDLESGNTHFGVPIFSYAELEEATNNFSSVNELGNGGFGTVYHGKLRDGRVVAIKHLYHNHYKQVELFMNEIEILTRLRHQNLVTLYGCTSNHSRELLLVYEFIPNGTIADHLHGDRTKVGSLTWPVRLSIAIETARALSYLHASDIIHRDVKTSNILLDNHFHVKVADFGLSRLFPTDVSHISTAPQGTPGYVDPEYHRCYQLTDKSDVYSFGVVLIELMSSKPAVDISRHRDEINLAYMAMNKIQNGALQDLVDPCLRFESDCATRGAVTLVAELAFRCLQHEKEVRPSMEEVVEILMAIGGEDEYKVVDNAEVMDILASYDIELLPKNMTPPPPPSPDTGTDKLINQSTMPSTSG